MSCLLTRDKVPAGRDWLTLITRVVNPLGVLKTQAVNDSWDTVGYHFVSISTWCDFLHKLDQILLFVTEIGMGIHDRINGWIFPRPIGAYVVQIASTEKPSQNQNSEKLFHDQLLLAILDDLESPSRKTGNT